MKRWMIYGVMVGFTLIALGELALAQHPRGPRGGEGETEADRFEDAVDLERFRSGTNFEWNTQQLVASGLTALHREHEKILKELEQLRKEVSQLKAQKGVRE